MPKHTLPILSLAGCLLLGCTPDEATSPGSDAVTADVMAQSRAGAGADLSPEVRQQLAQLRRVTAPFHDLEKAQAADYDTQLTPCWYNSALGAAMGYHHGNLALIDGTAELLSPELLVYEPQRDGSLRLVALEYIVPIAAWQGPGLPSVAGQEFHDNGAGLYILHIWLWRHNPTGLFADWNPEASCEFAAQSEDRA